MTKSLVTLSASAVQLALACAVTGATAQTTAPPSSYAGPQSRVIKSLSEQGVDDLLAGRGAGFAKAAELNGYPGPAHVLELKEPLQLSDAQLAATQALMSQHRAAARSLGETLVASEHSLDEAFGSLTVGEGSVRTLTAVVAGYQGELRAEHLRTQLAQTALLNPEQVQRYAQLRAMWRPKPSLRKTTITIE